MPNRFADKMGTAIKALATRRVVIECDRLPHTFERVPVKKILNWILVEFTIAIKSNKAWGWPTHLQLEPTNRCNIACALCEVPKGLGRPQGRMSFDLFKKIIDETADHLFLILLWDWGEPFLNPRIYEMINYAKSKGVQVITSTNGHFFARKVFAEKVVRSGLDSLIFAVDGIAQETYERYRVGGRFDKVITAIRNVVEARRALRSATPLINLRFIVMKHNEHEIPLLADFDKSLQVDQLTLRTLNPYEDGGSDRCDSNLFLPANPAYRRFAYDPEEGLRIRSRQNPCKRLWNHPAIHWNGQVVQCSCDPHGRYVLGDVSRKRFKDIWFGEAFALLRQTFRRNHLQLDLCSNCKYAFEKSCCGADFMIGSLPVCPA